MNQRQELFCQGVFTGKTATQAYIDAGYSPKTARFNASALLTNPNIKARLQELNDMALSAKVATKQECLERVTEIIRAKVPDFTTAGPDGSWTSIGPETPNAGAIAEVKSRTEYDENGDKPAVIISVKLHDPIKAIDTWAKLTGSYAPIKQELTGKDGAPLMKEDLSGKTDAELREYQEYLKRHGKKA